MTFGRKIGVLEKMTDHRMCLNQVLLSGSDDSDYMTVMMAEMVVLLFVDNSCSARLKHCRTWTQVCIQLAPLHSPISHLYE